MSCLMYLPSAELTRKTPSLSLQSKDAEITVRKKELLQMQASSPITPSEHLAHRMSYWNLGSREPPLHSKG